MDAQDASLAVSENAIIIGDSLRKARLLGEMDHAAVAKHLHLSVSQVKALEVGNYSLFKTPVFVRGHLRSYAKLLSLDGDSLVSLFDDMQPKEEVRFQSVSDSHSLSGSDLWPINKIFVFALIIVALSILAFYLVKINDLHTLSLSDAGAHEIASVKLKNSQNYNAVEIENEALSKVVETVEPMIEHVGSDEKKTGVIAAPLPVQVGMTDSALLQENAISVSDPNKQQLHLDFHEDCWVQVKALHGEILHEKLHLKGDLLDITVTTPVQLWFGKASAVSVIYNGSPINIPVKTGYQSARFVLGDEPSGDYE